MIELLDSYFKRGGWGGVDGLLRQGLQLCLRMLRAQHIFAPKINGCEGAGGGGAHLVRRHRLLPVFLFYLILFYYSLTALNLYLPAHSVA